MNVTNFPTLIPSVHRSRSDLEVERPSGGLGAPDVRDGPV